MYNGVPASNEIVMCRREGFITDYNVSVTCPTGHSINITCSGLKTTVNVTCPSYQDVPVCLMKTEDYPELGYNGSFEENPSMHCESLH